MPVATQIAYPMTLAQVEASAWEFRLKTIGLDAPPYLNVIRLLEFGLPAIYGENAHFQVCDATEMGSDHALAFPEEKCILIREDVYEGLHLNRPRDRMTVVHEFAHLRLHGRGRLARNMSSSPPKPWNCPEWQAKAWAGAMMVPAALVPKPFKVTEEFIAQEFGVSLPAAIHRLQQIRKAAK